MFDTDARIARLTARQHSVVSVDQLRSLGVTERQRQLRLEAGLLVAFHGAYRLAGAAPSFEQHCMALLLGAGRGAVLSHRTAAYLHGFDRFPKPDRLEITVPGDRRLQREDVRVHTSEVAWPGDVVRTGSLLVTSGLRTLCDLAAVVGRLDLEAAVDSALRDRRTSAAALYHRLADPAMRGRRGVGRLRLVFEGRPDGGAHSEIERAFLRLVRAAGLPEPTTQDVHRDRAGRVIRVDFLFAAHGLVVEVSGHRTHSTRQQRATAA